MKQPLPGKDQNIKGIRILYLALYPKNTAASQRFRVEQYISFLNEQGIEVKLCPFFSKSTYLHLYNRGKLLSKILGTLKGFFLRLFILPTVHCYTHILIQKKSTPIGPPWIEWLIKTFWKKKIIYDFDDAIWIPQNLPNKNKWIANKSFQRTQRICAWAHRVSVGNEYLAEFARNYSSKVTIIPTCVDTSLVYTSEEAQAPKSVLSIGWTGSHSTLPYLSLISDVLKNLKAQYTFRFIVIADRPPDLPDLEVDFIPWDATTEIQDLRMIDIGLMPLPDNSWTWGKCGFKAIQYMALGIPAVVSSVGVNTQIVDHGVNGFICTSHKEWERALAELLSNDHLRSKMGKYAREKIRNSYDRQKHQYQFLDLFLD